MNATIIKIDPERPSKVHPGLHYRYVFFKRDDGKSSRMMLVKEFRNAANWTGKIEVGNVLSGLIYKGPGLIDADSRPKIVEKMSCAAPRSHVGSES